MSLKILPAMISSLLMISAAFAQAEESIGVLALVNPDATVTRSSDVLVPVVGDDVFQNDALETDADGQMHLMFVDMSSFTVGPNSDVVIDRFVYDGNRETGELAMSAARGVMRFVGGELSKVNPVNIQTSLGTIGIRGGILLLQVQEDGSILAIFSFGTELVFIDTAGNISQRIVRPGFKISVSPSGDVSAPTPATVREIDGVLRQLEGPSNQGQREVQGEGNVPGEVSPGLVRDRLNQTVEILRAQGADVSIGEDGTLIIEFDENELSETAEQQIQDILSDLGASSSSSIPIVAIGNTITIQFTTGAGTSRYTVDTQGVTTNLGASSGIVDGSDPPGTHEFEITSSGVLIIEQSGGVANPNSLSFEITGATSGNTSSSISQGTERSFTIQTDGSISFSSETSCGC